MLPCYSALLFPPPLWWFRRAPQYSSSEPYRIARSVGTMGVNPSGLMQRRVREALTPLFRDVRRGFVPFSSRLSLPPLLFQMLLRKEIDIVSCC